MTSLPCGRGGQGFCDDISKYLALQSRVELLPAFKLTGKLVKIKEFIGTW